MDYCLEYKYLKDEDHIFKSISYEQLISLLDGFETALVFIGGHWCKNCQAIISELNLIGKKSNLDLIYNYDPKFINIFKEEEDLRDCKTLENKLKYYSIVEKIGFKSTEFVQDTLIPKMHIPFILGIRNGNCVGYYSTELIKDERGLHEEGKTEDKTVEFVYHVTELINKIKESKPIL